MDILKYMNSRDVADYLERISFEFNAMQAAYVVYLNDRLTIDERIELWREIIDTMPDCEYWKLSGNYVSMEPSAHASIKSYMEAVQGHVRGSATESPDQVGGSPVLFEGELRDNEFECFIPRIPIPFARGDIVSDSSYMDLLPFVYDRHISFDTTREHALEHPDSIEFFLLADDEDCFEALLDRVYCPNPGMYWELGHMRAFGYELYELPSGSSLVYSTCGACYNYLNLEYYRGPFNEGNLSILPIVSWFVMNEFRDEIPHSARVKREDEAERRFADRGIERPDCAAYDICALVNAGLRRR